MIPPRLSRGGTTLKKLNQVTTHTDLFRPTSTVVGGQDLATCKPELTPARVPD
jgi:hypothetical protein